MSSEQAVDIGFLGDDTSSPLVPPKTIRSRKWNNSYISVWIIAAVVVVGGGGDALYLGGRCQFKERSGRSARGNSRQHEASQHSVIRISRKTRTYPWVGRNGVEQDVGGEGGGRPRHRNASACKQTSLVSQILLVNTLFCLHGRFYIAPEVAASLYDSWVL